MNHAHREPPYRRRGDCILARIAVLALCLAVPGCARDITYDPKFGFAALAGRCFVLQKDVLLEREGWFGPYWLMPKDEAYGPDRTNAVAIVPAGTEFRAERLTYRFSDFSPYEVSGRFLSGRFSGQPVDPLNLLNLPNDAADNSTQWGFKRGYAIPCGTEPQ